MKRLIMFDYDGTIVDSFEFFFRACVLCLNRFGFPQYANRERILSFNDVNWFEALAAAGVPAEVGDAIEDAYVQEVSAEGGGPEPFDGMPEALKELGSTNRLVIITAARQRVVERFLADHGVARVTCVLGSDTETSKVRKMEAARAEFGRDLQPWYVGDTVGDTVGDILEGKQAGAGTIAVSWGWQRPETLVRASPDQIVWSPQELLELFARL